MVDHDHFSDSSHLHKFEKFGHTVANILISIAERNENISEDESEETVNIIKELVNSDVQTLVSDALYEMDLDSSEMEAMEITIRHCTIHTFYADLFTYKWSPHVNRLQRSFVDSVAEVVTPYIDNCMNVTT